MKSKIYLDPNDSFYKDAANDWLVKLMNLVGDEKARTMTNHLEGTWREIRDAIRDLANSQPLTSDEYNADDNVDFLYRELEAELGTRAIISGGEVLELDSHLESHYDELAEGDMPY